ncbi:MAG: transglutaminase domain-containing protein [Chloroflexi bacterium]|nr:transglutaminase domain-containing protein [Chloroflexota bacterium]
MTASVGSLSQRAPRAESERSVLEPEEGWLSILLLLAMVLSTVWSIDQAQWVEGTSMLFPIALAGIAVGMALGRSALRGWIALALGLLLGGVLCFIVVGQLLPPPSEMPGLFFTTIADTLRWFAQPSGVPPLVGAFQQLALNTAEFGERIGLWSQMGMAGRSSNDNAIFLLFIAYVAWLQGLIGAWGLFRLHDVVVAALPTGIALTTNAAYTGRAQAPFAIFIITLLLLAVSLNLATLQKRWARFSVDYPSNLLFDVTVSSFVIICLLAIFAFFGPRLGDNPVSNAFWASMGEQWSEIENASTRLFSGVNSPAGAAGGAGRDRLVLSGPVRLTQRVVMQVQSEEPYYWRGATYDVWTGHDWLTSDKIPLTRSEKQPVLPPRFALRKRTRVAFEISQSRSDLLYAPDEPVQLSIPYKVVTRGNDPATGDYASLRAKRPAIPALKYTVEAMTSIASVEELRNAPVDVPEWAKRYTQLPDVPQRVRDLSNTLTRGRRTTYDRAVAIEQFLRKYPYTLDVKAPPPDRDAVEYFLFDLKQGYCDYFASAMVVLLRTQGIPARLATGYVAGKFDNNTRKFIVTEEEAHSWPEVFFPNYGWMAFEPSGYRPPIVRPDESIASAFGDSIDCYEYGECEDMYGDLSDLIGLLPGEGEGGVPIIGVYQPGAAAWRRYGLSVLALLVLAGFGYLFVTSLRSGRRTGRELVQSTYRQMTAYGALFGMRAKPSETPLEYARALSTGITRTLEQDGAVSTLRLREFVGPPNGTAETIAATYVRTMYGNREPSSEERDRVVEGWKELRWKMPLLLLRDRRN